MMSESFDCPQCPFSFNDETHLENHISNSHNVSKYDQQMQELFD